MKSKTRSTLRIVICFNDPSIISFDDEKCNKFSKDDSLDKQLDLLDLSYSNGPANLNEK